jgi:hypothetical protein
MKQDQAYKYEFPHELAPTFDEVNVTIYFDAHRVPVGHDEQYECDKYETVLSDLDIYIDGEQATEDDIKHLIADHGGNLDAWIIADRIGWIRINDDNDHRMKKWLGEDEDNHEEYVLSMWANEIDQFGGTY